MPTPDIIQGIPLPNYGDGPAVPDDFAAVWYEAIKRAIPRFANTGARDLAYPSPAEGQYCYVDGAEKAFYVGRSGWKLHSRTATLPDPVNVQVAASQNVTSGTAVALPTPVAAGLVVAHPMIIDVTLNAMIGAGVSGSGTIYGAVLTLVGSGAGVALTTADRPALSGASAPLLSGSLTRTVKATAAGTLNIAVNGHVLTTSGGAVTVRNVDLTIKPVRWA